MSCMSLDRAHYQYIADALRRIRSEFNGYVPFHATRVKFGENADCIEYEKSVLNFINRLQTWNDRAYESRYTSVVHGKHAADWVMGINGQHGDINACQLLKALECVHYQCIDSEAYETSAEAEILQLIMRDCRSHIIGELPEYKTAKWSIT